VAGLDYHYYGPRRREPVVTAYLYAGLVALGVVGFGVAWFLIRARRR
jgi:hypothetical protein